MTITGEDEERGRHHGSIQMPTGTYWGKLYEIISTKDNDILVIPLYIRLDRSEMVRSFLTMNE